MQKVIILFLLYFSLQHIYAKDTLRTIRSTQDQIDIRIGDDFFEKGGWLLEPEKNPDIFKISRKWLSHSRKVTFTTDVDSLSFEVKPGKEYNLVIFLNDTPCNIRIIALANPAFQKNNVVIGISAGFILMLILLYGDRKKINPRALLNFGYVAVICFWAMTIISGYIHGKYDHFKDVISELGALGTRSEIFTSSSLLFIAAFCILFSTGFWKASLQHKVSVIPAILSYALPLTMIWAAIFTLGDELHSAAGPLPLLVILACILAFILWRKRTELKTMRYFSLLAFFIMMLGLLRFTGRIGDEYKGLVQRFFYVGWSIWVIAVSIHFRKKIKTVSTG